MRKLKNPKKTFREFNIRRRGLGLPEVTYKDYLNTRTPLDHRGVPHPKIKESETHKVSVFGESILVERNICIKCGCTKPQVDFICRYKSKKIENICVACEKLRKRRLYANKRTNRSTSPVVD